jgi:transposase
LPRTAGAAQAQTTRRRPLRRYKRRWKIERLFAWLGNFRRLVARYERSALNFLGFVQLGCILILLRQG